MVINSTYRAIEPSEVATYRRDGVMVLRRVVDESWRLRLETAIEREIEHPGPYYHGYETDGGGKFHGNLRLWESDDTFRDFCFHSPLPGLARQFFGGHNLRNIELKDGEALDSEQYPVVSN